MEFPDWFNNSPAKQNFETYLKPFAGLPNLKFLQLGVYTGDASVWLMENILTNPSSQLIDVDTWEGSDEEEHKSINFADVFTYYKNRTNKYHNLTYYKKSTMRHMRWDYSQYNFIYIDADHTAMGTFLDGEMAWDSLLPGGILAFDDYEWSQGKGPMFDPALGIKLFMDRHYQEADILHVGWQFWIRKK